MTIRLQVPVRPIPGSNPCRLVCLSVKGFSITAPTEETDMATQSTVIEEKPTKLPAPASQAELSVRPLLSHLPLEPNSLSDVITGSFNQPITSLTSAPARLPVGCDTEQTWPINWLMKELAVENYQIIGNYIEYCSW
jgi:hypothetical protein